MARIHPVRPMIYEDVVFGNWHKDEKDDQPWACICSDCNHDLLEGAGYGKPVVPSQCDVQGCTNTAEYFITMVDAHEM